MLNALRQMPRSVWLIGLISLINDTASEMLYPLLPLYLTGVLMAGPRALGLIEGVADATSSLMKLVSGVLVDKTRRIKPWLFFGYGLAGISRPMILLATSWVVVLFIRFADRLGKGLRSSPRDVLLADSVLPSNHGLAFGLHRALDNAGAVVGPLLAFAFLSAGAAIEDLFLLAIVPAVICLLLVQMLKEPPVLASATPQHSFSWRFRELPLSLKRYLVVVGLFSLGNSSNLFLLYRAKEMGVADAYVPLLWAIVSLVAALFCTPFAALSDRIGRYPMLLLGYGAFAVVYLVLGLLREGPMGLALVFLLYGFFVAATEGVEKAMVADLSPVERRGTAFGWFNMIVGICLLPSSVIFGAVYESISPAAAFCFSAGCAGLATLLLWWWFGRHRGDRSPT